MSPTEDNKFCDVEYVSDCPGCGNSDVSILESPSTHNIFLTDADEMCVTTGVCGCERCGLIYLNPRMGQKKLFEYYAKQSRIPRASLDLSSPFAALMELQLDVIENIKPIGIGQRVLEIGCAEGFFLKCFDKRCNSEAELYGVELSEKYISQAKANLPQATIFETPLEATDFRGIQFDFIILRHVFEHLSAPVECLKIIRSLLAPGGVLYIEVPDSQDMPPVVSRFYHHEHLLYFTPKVLNTHLASNGLKTLVCERFEGNPVGSGFSYPVIRSVSVASESQIAPMLIGYAREIHEKNDSQHKAYIDSLLSPVRFRLKQLIGGKREIGIFGAGPHTMDLLDLLAEDHISFVKIFDNNINKHGKYMSDIPIVKPDQLSLKSIDCVLISSAEFEKEMIAQVRELAGTHVEIIAIYNNDTMH